MRGVGRGGRVNVKDDRTIFDTIGLARNSDPDTSHIAAETVKPHIRELQAIVLGCLKAHPEGLTDEEVQRKTGMYPATQRGRRSELRNMGIVEWAGTKRDTSRGVPSRVWRLKN